MFHNQQAFIALGSNMSPERNLPQAVAMLQARFPIVRVSSVWESAPVGYHEQPHFCNAAVLIDVAGCSPRRLKQECRRIEQALGRVRDPRNKNGPRTIDLDIALLGQTIVEEDDLHIPDPEIPDRPFLSVPLAELAPNFMHPQLHCSLKSIAERSQHSDLTLRSDINLAAACQLPVRVPLN